VFDLSQHSPAYFRTERRDGTMMALKTNTKLYSTRGEGTAGGFERHAANLHLTFGGALQPAAKGPRMYDVESDRHPCELVTKYCSEAHWESFGDRLVSWLEDQKIEMADALQLAEFRFPTKEGSFDVPLFAFEFGRPVDGYPPKVQLERWSSSLFHNFERMREPLEIHPLCELDDPLFGGSVGLTKGFTRASILAFGVVQTLMVEDLSTFSDDEKEHFNKSFGYALVFGTCAEVQTLMATFTVELMKNSRWLLGACGRSTQPWWKSVETMTPAKQVLFMKRVLFGFQVRRKQVKHIATARLGVEQWEQLVESSCLLQHVLEEMHAATHDDGTPIFPPASIEKAERRSVEGDYAPKFQNLVTAKVDIVMADLTIWKDHLPSTVASASGAAMQGQALVEALDLQSIEKSFEADCLKVATDMAEYAQYVTQCGSSDRQAAVAKVLKLKAEQRRGSQAVVDWMLRNCKFMAGDYTEHHLDIVEACLFVIGPTIASSKVVAGKRGEIRRIEDKLDAKGFSSALVSLRMASETHGNRRLPLVFPAWMAIPDGVTNSIFQDYKVPRAKNAAPATAENERSFSEAQSAAQILGGLSMPTEVLDSILQDVKIDKKFPVAVLNLTPYDACLERACVNSGSIFRTIRIVSYSASPESVEVLFAQRLMAQKLLEVSCITSDQVSMLLLCGL
ncbi:unnamed protein product, partial [Symbiodinium necroappetens]